MVEQQELKERKLKQLDTILSRSSQVERWRGIKDFLIAYNPRIKPIDDQFILALNETRAEQLNDFGSNKAMNIRQLMDLPTYLYEALITADTELLPLMNSKDIEIQKKVWRKIAMAFPEYKIARKI